MKRLLKPTSKKDVAMFRECLDGILLSPPKSYTIEGLEKTFDWYMEKFVPNSHFYVAAEIIKNKIVRFHLGYPLSMTWGRDSLTLPIWVVGFIYNAPGSATDPRNHDIGYMVTDKFAELGVYTMYTILPFFGKRKNLIKYSQRLLGSSTLHRLEGYIDRVIDSQETLDKLRNDFAGLCGHSTTGRFLPKKYVRPIMLVHHNLKHEYRKNQS
jgi:hypothetical protein